MAYADTRDISKPSYPPLALDTQSKLVGAPPVYRRAFAQTVLEMCGKGYSLLGIAGQLGVEKKTILEWMRSHEEFGTACARAGAARLFYWEGRLIDVAETGGTGSQGQVAIFGVLNAARTAENLTATPWLNKSDVEVNHNISLAGVVERMMAKLEEIAEAKRAGEAKVIEHDQQVSPDSEGDVWA